MCVTNGGQSFLKMVRLASLVSAGANFRVCIDDVRVCIYLGSNFSLSPLFSPDYLSKLVNKKGPSVTQVSVDGGTAEQQQTPSRHDLVWSPSLRLVETLRKHAWNVSPVRHIRSIFMIA